MEQLLDRWEAFMASPPSYTDGDDVEAFIDALRAEAGGDTLEVTLAMDSACSVPVRPEDFGPVSSAPVSWEGMHTCSAVCACHSGGRPAPDFLGDAA